MAAEALRVDAAGVALHYREMGTGRPTVVLHGGGPGCSAWNDFGPVADRLAAGRRLILLDLPQFGASDVPVVTDPVFSWHARHLLAAIDALDLPTVDLLCQSFGGSVALRLAALAPERVRRIVLTGSVPIPNPTGTGVSGPAIRDTYFGGDGPSLAKMADLIGRYEWFDHAGVPAQTVRDRYAASIRPECRAIATDASRRGAPEDLTRHLPQVTAPVLLLWGSHDPFADPAYALRLASALPRADVHVLGRSRHHPQQERPAAYTAVARAFLDAD
ncbi:alpha/beta fold hydrolase [Micromonospora sp. NPDC049903]|uniref:alpha/beta fold hydrolase n=1 Tax=Micromonospora sp. NPDC049903 TaxID=3364276 RepID=UPI0037B4B421